MSEEVSGFGLNLFWRVLLGWLGLVVGPTRHSLLSLIFLFFFFYFLL
jgi:hypothetical protein